MDRIKKNFGFGCMRFPMDGTKVDIEQTKQMIDVFMEAGFNYFDTAHGYIEEQSETALKACLTSRYQRESFVLTNKLSAPYFNKQEDIRPFFESQLEACGVDYFDFYFMHAQCAANYDKFKRCRAYETGMELKEEGKIRHLGLSFHDSAEVLDRILTDYPQVEVVQLQINYLDYEDESIQGRKCQEVCLKHGKPIMVMEPVKGGHLANLPAGAGQFLEELHGGSPASYALRYVAGLEGVIMVLSGMSDMAQVEDNIRCMNDCQPLTEKELEAIGKVQAVFKEKDVIACTACQYCMAGCPKQISIPNLFTLMNTRELYNDWGRNHYYNSVHTSEGRKASDCIKCGLCEKVCPQHLPIRDLLVEVAKEFEK